MYIVEFETSRHALMFTYWSVYLGVNRFLSHELRQVVRYVIQEMKLFGAQYALAMRELRFDRHTFLLSCAFHHCFWYNSMSSALLPVEQ